MTRSHQRAGMTLLEVIVALTIAGSALASGAAVLGFLTDQQARTGTQTLVSANAVRATMRDWISEAQLTTEGDAEFRGRPTRGTGSSSDSDELTFVTSAPTDVSASGTIVRLYVASADSAAGRGLMAELKPWRHAGAPITRSLAPNATAMHVRYLASLSGRRSWLDSWATTSVLPAALELRIVYDGTTIDGDERAARALLAEPFVIVLAGRQ
jgi:prepilin-type N-terminal cleavage/methylation domain-containing protein